MTGKRLFALVAAAGVFGLSPAYAVEDADAVTSGIKPYTETIAAIEDESLDTTHVASFDESGVEVASNADDSDGQSAEGSSG